MVIVVLQAVGIGSGGSAATVRYLGFVCWSGGGRFHIFALLGVWGGFRCGAGGGVGEDHGGRISTCSSINS